MKTTQIFAAAVAFAMMASPALAQDDMMKEAVKDEAVKVMGDEVKEMTDGTTMVTGDPVTIETPSATTDVKDGVLMVKPDGEMIMKGDEVTMTPNLEKMKMKESWGDKTDMAAPQPMSEPMAAPAPAPAATPVNCPEGTTAQDNGTCMITGDYEE